MALTSKPMHPIDRAVAQVLAAAVSDAGVTRRTLAERAGMSTNRLGIILRGERPAATVGEAEVIASALGLDVFALFEEAERRAHADDYVLAALDRDDDAEVEAQQEEP